MATKKKTTATKAKAGAPAKARAAKTVVSFHTTGLPEQFDKTLPTGTVKPGGDGNLVVNMAKLSTGLLRDQRARMVSSMGCYSNPGGPGC